MPAKVRNLNHLKIGFYANGELVKSYEFADDYEDSVSAYDWKETNEFISIRNLSNEFIAEFDRDDLMPRSIPIDNKPQVHQET